MVSICSSWARTWVAVPSRFSDGSVSAEHRARVAEPLPAGGQHAQGRAADLAGHVARDRDAEHVQHAHDGQRGGQFGVQALELDPDRPVPLGVQGEQLGAEHARRRPVEQAGRHHDALLQEPLVETVRASHPGRSRPGRAARRDTRAAPGAERASRAPRASRASRLARHAEGGSPVPAARRFSRAPDARTTGGRAGTSQPRKRSSGVLLSRSVRPCWAAGASGPAGGRSPGEPKCRGRDGGPGPGSRSRPGAGPGSGSCPARGWVLQSPADLAADRRGVALQGRGPHVRLAGLEPGHGRLGGAHPGRDLGLGQPGRLPLRGQLADQRAAVHPPSGAGPSRGTRAAAAAPGHLAHRPLPARQQLIPPVSASRAPAPPGYRLFLAPPGRREQPHSRARTVRPVALIPATILDS